MKVLQVAAEAVPYAKTGGLADVAGALPKALRGLGVETDLILPFYRDVRGCRLYFRGSPEEISVRVGDKEEPGAVEEVREASGARVFLVRNDRYFDREFLYGTRDGDYGDNCERFTFFCRGVIEWIMQTGRRYDVIHCHDWQTALIPVYMKTLYADAESLADAASVFTVHNLGYQGLFYDNDLPTTGLGWDLFTHKGLEFYGRVNLMKGGLVFGDILSTVSETYSREIQKEEFGYGLEGVLYERRKELFGIVNGADYEEWNPATDRWITANYSAGDLSGKAACRRDLLAEFGFPDGDDFIIGIIGRFTSQKGFDLIERAGDWLAGQPLRLVIIGSGERRYEESIIGLGRKYPERIAVRVAYDTALARKIEAGMDACLMPSRYEPCGLNQIYSLKYGAVPIVRNTGGLADTVVDADLYPKDGDGFIFNEYSPEALKGAVSRALAAFADRSRWKAIILRGMKKDFSWDASARKYIGLYEKAIGRRRKR
ncbi:MAG: glycogen synthase GlgA [Syntrophorhabdaceae bacterium]|nr:glycogen synthase GlgA [Syntrophorhabdaceae bacterium]